MAGCMCDCNNVVVTTASTNNALHHFRGGGGNSGRAGLTCDGDVAAVQRTASLRAV